MKLQRHAHDPGALTDFYEQAFTSLGALCERTWCDRMEVIAEGRPAQLWNPHGALHQVELSFPSADSTTSRDAAREVFPGCPLTFRLAEMLRPAPVPLERLVLAGDARPPTAEVAEKLWRAQFPGSTRWRLETPFVAAHHFSLVVLTRCEIQAIDQHWSIHRLALSLPDGGPDEALASKLDFADVNPRSASAIEWPQPEPARWRDLIQAGLMTELVGTLDSIRVRQENYLRRELDRIDDYFENYEVELTTRASRSEATKLKNADRLAAAKAEHARRRQDQVQRHEIRVLPKIDALLLVAEPAWQSTVSVIADRQPKNMGALFIPRTRRWCLPAAR